VISWQKAMLLFFGQKIDVLEFYESEVHSVTQNFKVPCVIRLHNFKKPLAHFYQIKFSRNNVFHRDQYQCQYCKKRLSTAELTIDHVRPIYHGGQSSWENVVSACKKCNQKKGHKTLKEFSMPLLKQPKKPNIGMLSEVLFGSHDIPEQWKFYITRKKKTAS